MWAADVVRQGPEANSALLVCMRCGHFAESGWSEALCERGCSDPTRHGAAQIKRVRKGMHPRTGRIGRGAILEGLAKIAG